jgi:hypothetical protein
MLREKIIIMNIFVLDLNPIKAAEYHCDKHICKLLLESCQMMSTVCRSNGHDVGYKATHKNHPATLWCGESRSNWLWLKHLAEGLNEQYKQRFNKTVNHKSFDVIQQLPVPNIIDKGVTAFAQAMPECYKNIDPVVAYRSYYKNEKKTFATWKKINNTPEWWS